MRLQNALKRFIKYSIVGGVTFVADLSLLYFFTELLSWNYLVATGVAFTIAISANYALSRKYIFKGSLRPLHWGYVTFIGIAVVGLVVVVGLMALCVETLHWNYLVSRVLIAVLVGMWNYLMNLYINFKVAGKH